MAKLKNFRPQYLGQSTAYGHATYVTYRGRDPLPPDTDSCAILLPVPPGGAVNVFQFFMFNSKTRLRTTPCRTSLERARDPLQNPVQKWAICQGQGVRAPKPKITSGDPEIFLWSIHCLWHTLDSLVPHQHENFGLGNFEKLGFKFFGGGGRFSGDFPTRRIPTRRIPIR